MKRERVLDYFRELFLSKLEKTPSFTWDNLIASCCALYPEELFEEIKNAFEANLIDRCFISLEDVANSLKKSKEVHLNSLYEGAELIDDTVTEMEKWMTYEADLFPFSSESA